MLNPHFSINPNWSSIEPKATRDGFGDAVYSMGRDNKEIVVLTADLAESVRVEKFSKSFPDQFFEVGIAEQNMIGIAAGLAATGCIPFATSYAVFSPARNWDQIRVSVCYGNSNVKIVSSHAGISAGPDGAVHQGLEDIALMRVLPHMTVVSPCDYQQAYRATVAASDHLGPMYIRLSRYASAQITTKETSFVLGKAQILRYGSKLTVVATGIMVAEALKAAEELDAEVINVHTIKPLDVDCIAQSVAKTKKLIIIEEHQIAGGLGSAILEAFIQKNIPVPPTKLIGVNDQFGQSGSADELLQSYGLTWEHIIETYRDLTVR